MQTSSYGLSQPIDGTLRIPRAREGDRVALDCATITHARERTIPQGSENTRNNTRAKGTWGGARNRRDRVTTALRQQHAEGILRAIAVAELNGLALNRFWTVNYEWAGIDDSDGAAFVGRLLAQCGRYARARGGAFAAVWVREIGVKNGAHVHIAIHFPTGWKLRGHLPRKWIKAAGGKYSAKVSDMRPIGGRLDCNLNNSQHYWANAEAMGNYMVKGSADAVADELGLVTRKNGGRVIGKRWGRTQNLNSKKVVEKGVRIVTTIPY